MHTDWGSRFAGASGCRLAGSRGVGWEHGRFVLGGTRHLAASGAEPEQREMSSPVGVRASSSRRTHHTHLRSFLHLSCWEHDRLRGAEASIHLGPEQADPCRRLRDGVGLGDFSEPLKDLRNG